MKLPFDIPVAIFMFKRYKTVLRILEVLRELKPSKVYLIGDGPRNEDERNEIEEARVIVEKSIDWDCELIKCYSCNNRGVYDNIAGGAKWVFTREESAIFLEDDNLPELSFFYFCKELLERYRYESRVFWICGTNYLENYMPKSGDSYVFTRHLMPCGWASWSDKFTKYYDGDLDGIRNKECIKALREQYDSFALFKQQLNSAKYELYRKQKGLKYASWDFQMAISIREHGLYGISPCQNQIMNIGVDNLSTHGGSSFDNIMTKRFCGIKTYPLKFPLKHPDSIGVDPIYEKKVGEIILFPLKIRIKESIAVVIKSIFGINRYEKFSIKNIKLAYNNRRNNNGSCTKGS